MKAFLDTDMLFDLFDKEQSFSEAGYIKAMAFFNDIEIWASSKSFADVLLDLQRQHGAEEVKSLAASSRTFLYLCSITEENVFEAARRGWSDLDRCLASIAAEKIKADVIITRDKEAFEHSFIPIASPGEFIQSVRDDYGLDYDKLFE